MTRPEWGHGQGGQNPTPTGNSPSERFWTSSGAHEPAYTRWRGTDRQKAYARGSNAGAPSHERLRGGGTGPECKESGLGRCHIRAHSRSRVICTLPLWVSGTAAQPAPSPSADNCAETERNPGLQSPRPENDRQLHGSADLRYRVACRRSQAEPTHAADKQRKPERMAKMPPHGPDSWCMGLGVTDSLHEARTLLERVCAEVARRPDAQSSTPGHDVKVSTPKVRLQLAGCKTGGAAPQRTKDRNNGEEPGLSIAQQERLKDSALLGPGLQRVRYGQRRAMARCTPHRHRRSKPGIQACPKVREGSRFVRDFDSSGSQAN